MSGLRFIEANPFGDAYRSGRERDVRLEGDEFRLSENRRAAGQGQALDEALRQEYLRGNPGQPAPAPASPAGPAPSAPTTPSAPPAVSPMPPMPPMPGTAPPAASQPPQYGGGGLSRVGTGPDFARAAASVPGGGRLAMELGRAKEDQRDTDTRNALTALAVFGNTGNPGDLQTYRYLSERAGLRLPPQIEQDTRTSGLMARAMLLSEKVYRGAPDQANVFIQAYMGNGGDYMGAVNTAGMPRDKPNWTMRTVLQAGEPVLAFIDQNSGAVRVPTMPGGSEPVRVPSASAGGGGGASPAKIQLLNWLMANNVAKNPDEAWKMVNDGVANPLAARQRIYTAVYNSLVRNFTEPQEAQRMAMEAADQFIATASAEAGQDGPVVNGGAEQELPLGGDGTVDIQRLQAGQTYTFNGRRLSWDGQNFIEE